MREELGGEVLGEHHQPALVVGGGLHQGGHLLPEGLEGLHRADEVLQRRDSDAIHGLQGGAAGAVAQTPVARGGQPRSSAIFSRTFSAWPLDFTRFQWWATLPVGSTRTVERMTPMVLRPYMFFSP